MDTHNGFSANKPRALARVALCGFTLVLLTACGGEGGSGGISNPNLGADALQVSYVNPGSISAFTGLSPSSTSLQLNSTAVAAEHSVEVGAASSSGGPRSSVDLTTLQNALQIVADPSPQSGGFAIGHASNRDETFNTFTDFVSALSAELKSGTAVVNVVATGSYDSSSTTFSAKTLAVLLNN